MNIATIIQARMSSSRFPKKVLKPINGKPVLEFLIDQISQKNCDMPIIVATSKNNSDQKIVDYCIKNKIKYYEGNLLNVASRFYNIVKIYNLDFFVRVCADSPLRDGNLIKKSLSYLNEKFDIITNIMPRTYPKGQSIEVVNCKTFLSTYYNLNSEEDLEHVTRYFYKNSESYNILNFENDKDNSSINLSIDTHEDYEKICRIISKLDKNHYDYTFKDIINLYKQN